MDGSHVGGELHPLTLRYLDSELEADYQRVQGRDGLSGVRITAGASVVLWAVAAFLLPIGTELPAEITLPICVLMALISLACVIASRWAPTLDRQHGLVALLTAANGTVILILASIAEMVPGYAVSAIMLLFAYAFVSRTRFIFAGLRTVIIAIAFAIVVLTYRGAGNLVVDTFIFTAAVVGTLLALRRLELSRRRVFHQQRVIAEQSAQLEVEMEKSDRLLANVLPASIVRRLREGEATIADEYPSVTVLFTDIAGFTPLASQRNPAEVITMLGELYAAFDDLVAERGLEKIKTVGDSYMAAGGLGDGRLDDHPARVVDLGLAMLAAVERLSAQWSGLTVRIGVHTGSAAGGVIGRSKLAFDLWGDTVNVASRLEAQGVPNRVHVSSTTWQLVSTRFMGEPRGAVELRGLGRMETYLLTGRWAETRAPVADGTIEVTPAPLPGEATAPG